MPQISEHGFKATPSTCGSPGVRLPTGAYRPRRLRSRASQRRARTRHPVRRRVHQAVRILSRRSRRRPGTPAQARLPRCRRQPRLRRHRPPPRPPRVPRAPQVRAPRHGVSRSRTRPASWSPITEMNMLPHTIRRGPLRVRRSPGMSGKTTARVVPRLPDDSTRRGTRACVRPAGCGPQFNAARMTSSDLTGGAGLWADTRGTGPGRARRGGRIAHRVPAKMAMRRGGLVERGELARAPARATSVPLGRRTTGCQVIFPDLISRVTRCASVRVRVFSSSRVTV
jgi:hypothetical protein